MSSTTSGKSKRSKSRPWKPEYYTPDEAAAHFRVTRRCVYTWLRTGKLKGTRIGGVWRITRAAMGLA